MISQHYKSKILPSLPEVDDEENIKETKMKITKSQLKQLIKEEYDSLSSEHPAVFYIKDAIQLLEAEEDPRGTLFQAIGQLQDALEKLK